MLYFAFIQLIGVNVSPEGQIPGISQEVTHHNLALCWLRNKLNWRKQEVNIPRSPAALPRQVRGCEAFWFPGKSWDAKLTWMVSRIAEEMSFLEGFHPGGFSALYSM